MSLDNDKMAEVVRPFASVADKIRALVAEFLQTQNCNIKYMADRLCMHTRTLQRRLAAEGLSFDEIVDMARCKRAQELLAQRNLSMSQIAGLLGFAEQSSFNHACQRWFGRTPRNVRQDQEPEKVRPSGAA